jgi:hypothetical protein
VEGDANTRGPWDSGVQGARGTLATGSRINGPGPTNRANRYPSTRAIRSRMNGQDRASGGCGGICSGRPRVVPCVVALAQSPEARLTEVSRGAVVVWVAREVGEDLANTRAKPGS